MPDVSILIPAYRPDFFEACLDSALAQSHADFELVVSDDCPTNDIRDILETRRDPRIRYSRNPTRGRNFSNLGNLLRLARGRYLKFLWDDDVLYPESVELLLRALRSTGAGLAFHHRHFIDAEGAVTWSPSFLTEGATQRIPDPAIFLMMVGRISNWIGEPSNMMVDAGALRAIRLPFEVEGRGVRFLNDVALLYNFARSGRGIVGVGAFGSAFRQHGTQGSNESAPIFASGVFEWELLVRSARAAALLPDDVYRSALETVRARYRGSQCAHPVFSRFLALDAGARPQDALSERFLRVIDLAYFEMDVQRVGPVLRPPLQ